MLHSTYQPCAKAEYEAFVDRHLEEFLPISKNFSDFRISHEWEKLMPYDDEELIMSRPPRMRKRYRSGLEKDPDKKDAIVRMFVKYEHMKLWDGRKPPRAIQYRSSSYTAALAKYCVPLEKHLAKSPMDDNFGFPMMTKGRNAFELAELIHTAYTRANGRIYLVDHSAYDAHLGPPHLAIERAIFRQVFPGTDVVRLLRMQKKNTVYSSNGLKVKCVARRMSGDANTSVGGSMINYVMLRYIFGHRAIIMVNGDDSIIFSPNPPLHSFDTVGMVTKFEVVDFMEDIEFCQMKPVLGAHGWAMVKNPQRILSRKQTKLSSIDLDVWLRVVSIGEMYASPYDPITQALCRGFAKRSKSTKWNSLALSYNAREMSHGLREIFPSDETSSVSYSLAWGLTPSEAKAMAKDVERWAATCVDATKTQQRTSFH